MAGGGGRKDYYYAGHRVYPIPAGISICTAREAASGMYNNAQHIIILCTSYCSTVRVLLRGEFGKMAATWAYYY